MFERENDPNHNPADSYNRAARDVPGDNWSGWSDIDAPEDVEEEHPLDAADVAAMHSLLMGHYRRELDVQYGPRQEMALDEALYDHDQWPAEAKAALEARGQVPLVYNVVFTSVNWILGSQRQKPMDYSILPRRKEGLKQAERKTELMKYLSDINHRPLHENRAFGEVVKAGLSWLEGGCQDPEDGPEIVYERYESWRNIIYDSAASEWDMSDGRYIFRVKWVDLDRAIAMFPEREHLLRQSIETVYEARAGGSISGDESMDSLESAHQDYPGARAYAEFSSRSRVRLIEAWYRTPKDTEFVRGGDFQGEVFDPWSPGHVGDVNEGRASIVSKVKERTNVAIMCEKGMLVDTVSPYRHNKFPFTPIWGYRTAATGFPYGMIRGVRDIQIDVNKRASKSLFHLSAQRSYVEEGSVSDMAQTREEVMRPDAFIVYKKGFSAPTVVTDLNLAAAHGEAMSRGINMIEQTSGVTGENLGQSTNATSGKAIIARQEQGMLTTNVFFENLRFSRRIHGEKQLANVEQFFTKEKHFRITNQRGNSEHVTINNDDPDDDNVIGATKSDFVVSEEDYRATSRQHSLDKLFELVGVIGQSNPVFAMNIMDLIVEAMDVPKQDEIVKRIRQTTGMSDPDADPNNPDEETQALMAQKQETAEFQKAMAMAEKAEKEGKASKAQADAMRAMAQARKGEAEISGLFLENIRTAVETAMHLAGMPNAGATADRIMQTAAQQQDAAMNPQPDPAAQQQQQQQPQMMTEAPMQGQDPAQGQPQTQPQQQPEPVV